MKRRRRVTGAGSGAELGAAILNANVGILP